MSALRASLEALPEVDLHCHIEGTVRAQTVIELAHANGVPLPSADPTELYRYDSLDGFPGHLLARAVDTLRPR